MSFTASSYRGIMSEVGIINNPFYRRQKLNFSSSSNIRVTLLLSLWS